MDLLSLKNGIIIPDSAMEFRYSRSGGKGGQNVNKVSTKVELLVSPAAVRCPEETKRRLLEYFSPRLNAAGQVRFVSQESRSQWQNKQLAVEKMIRSFERASREEKERVPTKRTRSSHESRLHSKKKHSQKKSSRTQHLDPDA